MSTKALQFTWILAWTNESVRVFLDTVHTVYGDNCWASTRLSHTANISVFQPLH